MEPYQVKILELLCKKELLLSRLYRNFSEMFPEYRRFWQRLADEEEKHAKWIKDLYRAEKMNLVTFSEGKIKTYTITSFNERIENLIQKAESGEIDLQMAGAYALDIEESLIEKNIFTCFKVIHESAKGLVTKIDNESKKHFSEVKYTVRNFTFCR